MNIFERLKAIKAKAEAKGAEGAEVSTATFQPRVQPVAPASEPTPAAKPAVAGGGIGRIRQLAGQRTAAAVEPAAEPSVPTTPDPVDAGSPATPAPSVEKPVGGGRTGLLKPAGGLVRRPVTTPASAVIATPAAPSTLATGLRILRNMPATAPAEPEAAAEPDEDGEDFDADMLAAFMGVANVPQTAAPSEPSEPVAPEKASILPPNSALARIKSGSVARTAVVKAIPAVSLDGSECANTQPVYSPEQFIEDWPELPEGDDWHPDVSAEYNGSASQVISKGCARINQLFDEHLSGLSVQRAPEPVIREIGAIVKLTFLRVKDAPGAYDMLDLADRAALIKGLRAMTAKRHAAAQQRAPRDAANYSAALEGMVAADATLGDMMDGIKFDLDLGSL